MKKLNPYWSGFPRFFRRLGWQLCCPEEGRFLRYDPKKKLWRCDNGHAFRSSLTPENLTHSKVKVVYES